jgi:pimeloyl-ACP methyl ester carboxylesterase
MKLVFSHGNSFPGGTYRLLIEAWRAAGFDASAIEKYGHDPRFPVTGNWPRLREELIHHLDALNARNPGPAVLVGHSMGGLISLMAASRRPDLVRALVLMDSPMMVGWRAHSLLMLKRTGLLPRISPGKVSQTRRYEWPSREAALMHFQNKPAFARWDPRVLQDYVNCGTEPIEAHGLTRGTDDGPVTLSFRRDIETRVYNTMPHHLGPTLRRHPLRCPVGFIAGKQSVEMRHTGPHNAKALAPEHFQWVEGTHLFPMEHPDMAAQAALDMLGKMGVSTQEA